MLLYNFSRFIAFLLMSIILLCIKPQNSLGYDTPFSHPKLVEETINFFNMNYPLFAIAPLYKPFILAGSIDEDKEGLINGIPLRSFNHFYDPVNKKGLDDPTVLWLYKLFVKDKPVDSITWATSQSLQSNPVHHIQTGYPSLDGADFSWDTAIEKANNKEKLYAFKSIGHLLHLLQDLTVPAHTRNEPHPDGDFYEIWVEEFLKTAKLDTSDVLKRSEASPPLFNSLHEYFHSIAEYTNKHFLTMDSIDKYHLPVIDSNNVHIEEKENGDRVKYIYSEDETSQAYKLAAISYPKLAKYLSPKRNYYLDDSCIMDYFTLLSHKAVLYGAGLMRLFFDSISDITPPSSPSALTAIAVSSSHIYISWSPSIDNIGVAGYKIYRDGSYITSATVTSASDIMLNPSTLYCYIISAYDAAGNESERRNLICAKTMSE